jgi:hypothetical protein
MNYFHEGALSIIEVKPKPITSTFHILLLCGHVILGYADLISDCFAIAELHSENRIVVMGFNIAVLILNSFFDLSCAVNGSKCLAFFQLHILFEAIESYQVGKFTEKLLRSKKIDAVCRSMPSMLVQTYTLLTLWETLSYNGFAILTVSILLGLGASATTLASVDVHCDSLFSIVGFFYSMWYSSDLVVRVLTYSMIFIAIQEYGLIVLIFDSSLRAIFILVGRHDYSRHHVSIFFFLIVGSDNLMFSNLVNPTARFVTNVFSTILCITSLLLFYIFPNKLFHQLSSDCLFFITILVSIGTFGKYAWYPIKAQSLDQQSLRESNERPKYRYNRNPAFTMVVTSDHTNI